MADTGKSFDWGSLIQGAITAYTAYQNAQNQTDTANLNNQPRTTTSWRLPYANDLIRNMIPYILGEAGNVYNFRSNYSHYKPGPGLQRIQDALAPIIAGTQSWNELSGPQGWGSGGQLGNSNVVNGGNSSIGGGGLGGVSGAVGGVPGSASVSDLYGNKPSSGMSEFGNLFGINQNEQILNDARNSPGYEYTTPGADSLASGISNTLSGGARLLGAIRSIPHVSDFTDSQFSHLLQRMGVPADSVTRVRNANGGWDIVGASSDPRQPGNERYNGYGPNGAGRVHNPNQITFNPGQNPWLQRLAEQMGWVPGGASSLGDQGMYSYGSQNAFFGNGGPAPQVIGGGYGNRGAGGGGGMAEGGINMTPWQNAFY